MHSPGFYKVMEKETPRVKSVTFHPKMPIVVIAQHSGVIQAYDYQLRLLVHEFKDHVGPVRAVVFHPLLGIFASGGDDTKIRVWDYQTKRIVATFEGHKDYVRSLDFHAHQPYLLSTSDDQTIRIWNFQSSKMLVTLPGHTHYVMCGRFFLENYIVSCSLDQTIRIWDYKNINEKKGSLLSLPNVYAKQILDGHDKGINSISVCKNSFATVSDDREVKVWEFDGNTAFEREAFVHHQNIASSVLFTETHLISNGEDGMLAVHSFEKKTTRKFQIDFRFWCIAGFRDLYCVGHDSGFYVFSLENTEKVFCYDAGVYYVKEKVVYFNNFKTEEKLFSTQREIVSVHRPPVDTDGTSPRREMLLVQYEGTFDVLVNESVALTKSGTALLYRDHIVVKEGAFIYRTDLRGGMVSDDVEFNYDHIFRGSDHLVATKGSVLFLVSLDDFRIVNFKNVSFEIRSVVSCDTRIAALGSNNVAVLDNDLNIILAVQELAPVNSGFFSDETFFYSTIRQIKFANRHSGILRSLENAFVFHRDRNTIYYLSKEIESVEVDLTELHFKNAVKSRGRDEAHSPEDDTVIREIIESGDLPGLAPLAFLVKNKRGDIALPYITDPRQKFELCLSNGRYEESLELSHELGDASLFKKLAEDALRSCCVDVAESCFEYLRDDYSLFMLYICSRQDDKIAELYQRASAETKITIAKYLKDKEFITSVLEGRAVCTEDTNVAHGA